jgi:hypothetical protein
MTQTSHPVNPSVRFSLLWLLASGLILAAITAAPITSLLNLFHDDSFFYMVIARNHAAGLGYSFDGLNMTNGFHPLWLWTLSSLGSLIALTGDQGIRVVVALQTILSLSAALMYVRLLGRYAVSSLIQGLFFLAYLFLCTLADIGQESALYSFLVALIISILFDGRKSGEAKASFLQCLALMLLAMLTVLARLDCVFLLGGIALALILVRRKAEAFVLLLGMTMGLAGVFGFNYLVFGHGYSISSWLKSGFDLNKALQILIPGLLVRVGLVYLLLAGALWQLKRVDAFNGLRSNLSKVSFATLVTLCVFLAFSAYFAVLFLEVSALGSWYFNQALGLSLFLYALSYQDHRELLLRNAQKPVHFISFLPLVFALVIGAALFSSKWMWARSSDATLEMGQWLAANTQPSDVIFQRDGAGAVSYFAQRPIINGDGLVNNMQYQVMLRSGRLCDYLKDQQVQYLVSNTFVNTSGLVQDYIFLWTKGLVSLPLTNVSSSDALYSTQANPQYRVFRLTEAGTGCQW